MRAIAARTAWRGAQLMLLALYAVMWAGGAASYLIAGRVRPGDEWTAPLFLALAGALVLLTAQARMAAALLLAGSLGFGAEWIGLTGGWLFGRYAYSDVLAPAVLGVPLVIGSAWLVLAAYVHCLLAPMRLPAPIAIAAGAGLLTALDLLIDPLAAGPLGYWRWLDGGGFYGVPVRNFAGWFATGMVILPVLRLAGADARAPAALPVGLSIVAFFTVLAVAFELALPAAAGAMLIVLHVGVRRRVAPRLHAGGAPAAVRW